MTVAQIVEVLFTEVQAGRLMMEDEVPAWMLTGGRLPRMNAAQYLQDRGVTEVGQEKAKTVQGLAEGNPRP